MENSKSAANVDRVLEKHRDRLLAEPGVVGVGVGDDSGAPVIIVMVTQGATAMAQKLPKELGGYPVKVEISGEISAL